MSTEQNKSTAIRFFMEQDKRKGPLDPEICSSTYSAQIGSFPTMNLEGHSQFGQAFYVAFPDLYHTIDDVIAEEQKATVRLTLRGTHQENFSGIPATGKSIEVSTIAMMQMDNGKIARLDAIFDQMTMLQQLGVIPAQ